MNILIKKSYANPNDISIPRRNLVTIVIHCEANNEDACVLSKEREEGRSAAWYELINFTLPEGCSVVEPAAMLKDQE